jgi:hypothetical protein
MASGNDELLLLGLCCRRALQLGMSAYAEKGRSKSTEARALMTKFADDLITASASFLMIE